MEEVSELSVKRLMVRRAEIVEEHAITLTHFREDLMHAEEIQTI